jgi:hypothetical protein
VHDAKTSEQHAIKISKAAAKHPNDPKNVDKVHKVVAEAKSKVAVAKKL